MELPLFPLHVVLFPGRPLPLHVFEPRYRTMLDDCLASDRRFGVVAIRSGSEVGGGAEVYEVGTVAHIESVEHLDDGRANLLARGVCRFRLTAPLREEHYPMGRVELLDEHVPTQECEQRSARLRELLEPYLGMLGAPRELLERLPSEPLELAYLAASALQSEVPDAQRILELDSPAARVDAVLGMLRREACLVRHLGTVGSLRPVGPGGPELN